MILIKDRVLIKKLAIPKTTKGGIFLPLQAIENPQMGKIVALGTTNPDELRIGDLVLFRKFEGQRLYLNEEELFMFFLNDILAVIRD